MGEGVGGWEWRGSGWLKAFLWVKSRQFLGQSDVIIRFQTCHFLGLKTSFGWSQGFIFMVQAKRPERHKRFKRPKQ